MRARSITGISLAIAALTACSGAGGYEKNDPEAHMACTKFLEEPSMEDVSADDELAVTLGTVLIVGEHAAKAESPEVRETAEELPGLDQWLLDDEALIATCEDAGYEVADQSVAAHYLARQG